jgi:regulator of sigma E protease
MRWLLLQRAVDHDQIDLEVINPQHEIHPPCLDVSVVRRSGWEGDALERLGLSMYRPRLPPSLGKVNPNSAAAAPGCVRGTKSDH